MPLEVGTLLAERYVVVRALKSGGMGAVYEARDRRLADSACAIKQLLDDGLEGDSQVLVRRKFNEEMQFLATLNHPGIPRIRDFFTQDARRYLVMDLVEGDTLEQELDDAQARGEAIPVDRVVDDVLEVLQVLEYLHSRTPPVLHRDIKPGNLIRERSTGRVKLVDFGIARMHQAARTTTHTQLGTLSYAPLEQIQGHAEPRSDLYALAATMHHLISGQLSPPLSVPPLQRVAPTVDRDLAAIVNRALQPQPFDRYATATEMREALQAWRRAHAHSTAPTGTGTALPAKVAASVPLVTAPMPRPPAPRTALAVAAAVVAAAVLALWGIFHQPPPPPVPEMTAAVSPLPEKAASQPLPTAHTAARPPRGVAVAPPPTRASPAPATPHAAAPHRAAAAPTTTVIRNLPPASSASWPTTQTAPAPAPTTRQPAAPARPQPPAGNPPPQAQPPPDAPPQGPPGQDDGRGAPPGGGLAEFRFALPKDWSITSNKFTPFPPRAEYLLGSSQLGESAVIRFVVGDMPGTRVDDHVRGLLNELQQNQWQIEPPQPGSDALVYPLSHNAAQGELRMRKRSFGGGAHARVFAAVLIANGGDTALAMRRMREVADDYLMR